MTDYRDKAHNAPVEVVIVPAWQTVLWGGMALGMVMAVSYLFWRMV